MAAARTFALAVTKSGTGTRYRHVVPVGINCGTTCNASYNSGTSVTLTAAAASGSTFGGWGGACSGTATACTVSMTAARDVTATFNSSTTSFTLSVTKAGSGRAPSRRTPGDRLRQHLQRRLRERHVGDADRGGGQRRELRGLERRLLGHGTCTVSMTQARAVTATFNTASTFALGVTRAGTGTGTRDFDPSGINCGTSCTANYAAAHP